jgi:hypothetical protein
MRTVPATLHTFHCYGYHAGEFYLQDSYGTCLWYDGTFRLTESDMQQIAEKRLLRGLLLEPAAHGAE